MVSDFWLPIDSVLAVATKEKSGWAEGRRHQRSGLNCTRRYDHDRGWWKFAVNLLRNRLSLTTQGVIRNRACQRHRRPRIYPQQALVVEHRLRVFPRLLNFLFDFFFGSYQEMAFWSGVDHAHARRGSPSWRRLRRSSLAGQQTPHRRETHELSKTRFHDITSLINIITPQRIDVDRS
jgi:hypothetical protein